MFVNLKKDSSMVSTQATCRKESDLGLWKAFYSEHADLEANYSAVCRNSSLNTSNDYSWAQRCPAVQPDTGSESKTSLYSEETG